MNVARMFLAVIIASFVVGVAVTLIGQWVIFRKWLSYQPKLFPPYKDQHEKVQLPKSFSENLSEFQGLSSGRKDGLVSTEEKMKDKSLLLNVLTHFLFAELKDTARIRRWVAKKLNVEFADMLASNTGKWMNQIQVRDFNLGSNFPTVKDFELKKVEMSNDKDVIQNLDISLDILYDGGFQITLDVDVIFGAWAYLSIHVTHLSGRARLQLSRVPFTHWSFSFYEEPKMEFQVDSRFNGRPIPQISSLIVNQLKRTIRKKHVLPAYKMRFKPLFLPWEEPSLNPEMCFRGKKLSQGQLSVKVLKCSRLQPLPPDSKLFCTVSVDKEKIEDVWKHSWQTLTLTIQPRANVPLGLTLKEQFSGEKTEKKRVVTDKVTPDSPAAQAGLCKGDIIEFICNVRVLSIRHATKQMKTATENLVLTVRRNRRLNDVIDEEEQPNVNEVLDFEIEVAETNVDSKDDSSEFVNINLKESSKPQFQLENPMPPNNTMPAKSESPKLSNKLTQKLQLGKKKLFSQSSDRPESLHEADIARGNSRESIYSHDDSTDVSSQSSASSLLKDGSQSAKSSPQKITKDGKQARAMSDTNISKVSDGDSVSISSDIGSYGNQAQDRRIGETATRELQFSTDPEWGEEFEFDCNKEDQYVNVCVWCRVQTNRNSKPLSVPGRGEGGAKLTPPNDELPFYNVTTKIGYTSILLSDIAASCLLTLQGDAQYTVYLKPPEENITASRAKIPFSSHPGFDPTICHGDITLSFVHKPFEVVSKMERKIIVNNVLNPPLERMRAQSLPKMTIDGQHSFHVGQFPSNTHCQFCGKKIWFKGGQQCYTCKMICHKKCVDKCKLQTKCTGDGPVMSSKPSETWLAPVRSVASVGASLGESERKVREGKSLMGSVQAKVKGLITTRDQQSLPMNIPNKAIPSRLTSGGSPSRSPKRSPSQFESATDGHVPGMRRNLSNKSLEDKGGYDSEEDVGARYRYPNFNLDDNVVLQAKEKGKALYSDLPLHERMQTLDDMITKLQDQIDENSEAKSELLKSLSETSEPEQRRNLSKRLEKSEEKLEALMMMMVHYCAGMQHCLDQEEAHKRLQGLTLDTIEDSEDVGIEFDMQDVPLTLTEFSNRDSKME